MSDKYLIKTNGPRSQITKLTKDIDQAYLDKVNRQVEAVLYAIGRIYQYTLPFVIKMDVAVQKLDIDEYLSRVLPQYYGHISFYSRYSGSTVSLRIDANWLLQLNEVAGMPEESTLSIVIMHEIMHVLLGHLTQLKQIQQQAATKGYDLQAVQMLANLVGDAMVYAHLQEFFNPINEFGKKMGHITPEHVFPLGVTMYDLVNKSLYQIVMELLHKAGGDQGVNNMLQQVLGDQNQSRTGSVTIVEDGASVSETERQLQQEAIKSWGNMPGNLKLSLERAIKYKEPWDLGLSKAVSNLFYDQYSFSRRHPYYTYNTDFILGCYSGVINKLVVGLDVSGSMIEDLPYYIERLGHVLSIKGLESLHIVAGDTEVTLNETFKIPFKDTDVQKILKSLEGGGGTDFRPLFKEAYKFWERNRSSMLGFVLFTDTYGDFPATAPPFDTIIVTKETHSQTIPKWVTKVIVI